jgi:hypothetical protein
MAAARLESAAPGRTVRDRPEVTVAGRLPDSCGMVWATVIASPMVVTGSPAPVAGAVAGAVGETVSATVAATGLPTVPTTIRRPAADCWGGGQGNTDHRGRLFRAHHEMLPASSSSLASDGLAGV